MMNLFVVLLMLLTLSSQAFAAVKWNNPGSGTGKSLATVNEGDGTKIPDWLMQQLATVMHNGLEKKMVLHMNNAIDAKELKFVNKDGRNAILIELTYEDEGAQSDWRRFGKPGFAQRVQIKLSDLFAIQKGEERWYKLSYYLEGDNITPNEGNGNAAHQLSLFDLKIQSRPYNDIGVGFGYAMRNNQFSFDFIQDTPGKKVRYAGHNVYEFPRNFFYLDPTSSGNTYHDRWVDVVLNIKWSEDGFTRVWADNELVINAHSAPLGGKPTKQYSFKFGPYRNDMPPNRRAPDVRVYYADIGLEETCDKLLPNCDDLMSQITPFQSVKHIGKNQVCFGNQCGPIKADFRSMSPVRLERFVGRRVWDNMVHSLQANAELFSGLIKTSTIIKDRSPVRHVTYDFRLDGGVPDGTVSFIDAASNDGFINSESTLISFAVNDNVAQKIETECGLSLMEREGVKFPTFSMQEAYRISFTRFGYETDLLSESSKCQIPLLQTYSDRFWFELLHLAGKSLRGSNEKGNSGLSPDKVTMFETIQNIVKAKFKR